MQAIEMRMEDRVALEHLEESLWRGETRFDYKFMDKIVAQDFFEFGRSGRVYERADILDLNRQTIDAVLPLPDLRIRLLNEDTAQVTYTSAVKYEGRVQYGR